MTTNYEKGRSAENYIKRKLEKEGWVVVRCAASKPVDLIAFKDGEVVWIEVKSGKSGKPSEKEVELAKKAGVKLVLMKKRRKRYVLEVIFAPAKVKVVKYEKPKDGLAEWRERREWHRTVWDMIFG